MLTMPGRMAKNTRSMSKLPEVNALIPEPVRDIDVLTHGDKGGYEARDDVSGAQLMPEGQK